MEVYKAYLKMGIMEQILEEHLHIRFQQNVKDL
jgi:hypothetical protein